MKIRNGCASLVPVIALSVLGGVAGVASAQEGGAAAPAAPAVVPPEAKALMDRARAAYKDAKTYQDKVSLKFEMRATDPDGNAQNQDESEDMSFTFGGPKKFTMEHKDFRVVSDGATQTAHLKFLSQYVQKPAPEGLIDEAKLGPIGILGALHVPAVLLITPGEHAGKFPLLAEITEVKAEEIKGKAGKRVLGKGEIPDMPFEMMVPMSIWFADDTGLVGEVTMDLKPAYADMMGGDMKIEKAMGTVSFAEIRVNEEVAPETFVFTPGSEDKKVDSFGPEQGPDPQLELVGTAAPSFKGSDLEGKPLSLSDYKGKILVLDFWATWCGPCMQVIPKIQELSAEYADKGVVVLGMNQDEPDALETVKQTVEKKKLTFRQFMDKEGAVAQQFMVTGIPCTVIIDKEGVIQWIHTGGSPGLKQEISEALEKLLKGESLVKPKEAPAGEPAK